MITATGALVLRAVRTGDHDELVVALALACMVDPAGAAPAT
jgi:hypothetical protein